MAVARYLVDKSVLARAQHPSVAAVFDPLLDAGLLALCAIGHLEILFSARSAAERDGMSHELTESYEWLHTDDVDLRRAIEVQGLLAAQGRHRGVSIPDLIIAAVAERHRVTVLHYDADFDLIGEVTGQPTQWIVARGSV